MRYINKFLSQQHLSDITLLVGNRNHSTWKLDLNKIVKFIKPMIVWVNPSIN